MVLLLCSLSAFFVVELFKRARPIRDWWKPMVALIVSAGVSAFFYRHHPYSLAAFALAGAGLSLIAHKLYRYFSAAGDRAVVEILSAREPRPPRR
jgi:hypothetical protein